MPVLTPADKLWIAFQLTCAVTQIHEEGFHHGDIKTDNVVVTSWNWVLLTDFAPYKPTYLPSENLGDYQFFFTAETNEIHGCYLAPEKFVAPGFDFNSGTLEARQTMDVFSLGCVLAELFLNGVYLFDLSKLQSYKNGKYDLVEVLKDVQPIGMRNLIIDMLQLNSTDRKTAKEYVHMMVSDAIPTFITQFGYYFMGTLLYPELVSSDRKVAMIYTHLDVIWRCCFNKQAPLIEQSINNIVFESIRCVPMKEITSNIRPMRLPYCVEYGNEVKISEENLLPISDEMKY
jgi:phosphoinositide-3-kinase regulatory subunit 4